MSIDHTIPMDLVQEGPLSPEWNGSLLSENEKRIQHLQQTRFLIQSRLKATSKLRSDKVSINKLRDLLEEHTTTSFEDRVPRSFLEGILKKIDTELHVAEREILPDLPQQKIQRKRCLREEATKESQSEEDSNIVTTNRRIRRNPSTALAQEEHLIHVFMQQVHIALQKFPSLSVQLEKLSEKASLDDLQQALEDIQ